jgi:hypothetical protein
MRESMSLSLENRPFFVNEPQKQQFGQLRATKTLCLLRAVLFGTVSNSLWLIPTIKPSQNTTPAFKVLGIVSCFDPPVPPLGGRVTIKMIVSPNLVVPEPELGQGVR